MIRTKRGFTLIEILIVVIFIVILATIIIRQVRISSDDAKLNTLKTNLVRMRKDIGTFEDEDGDQAVLDNNDDVVRVDPWRLGIVGYGE